ncbi:unnamed protein product [Spirodela intermedia]|uniref:MCAfunc domain-containing protein n=1 Tax=Spirodela intermedia TaxID=51605 RepID=A0A7I8IF38_SPIIN|nr:unnamed protein product [Spirodela intermedia]CAA6655995.1 unnamed protein product [Spirodela intermedia]
MASSWEHLGELGTVGQLVGADAVRLIGMIVQAANTARMHKNNCRQFQLKISELKKYPETREPLEQLEEALRRSYVLVNSCQDRSYLYLLAMGWNIVYQFRKAQTEIDRYLRLVPLITLVNNARIRERLEDIEKDQREYTLDEEDRKVQDVILNRDPSQKDALVLKKTLSCSYPNLPFDKALRKESEKLQLELQRSQTNLDVGQCEVIQHLIGVAETVASSLPEKDSPPNSKQEQHHPGYARAKEHSDRKRCPSTVASSKESPQQGEWHSDLLDCCSEPYLCIRTFFFPCGTLSKIACVAKRRPVSSAEVCNDLMAYSLVLSCCCYTCCIRRNLRQLLNIEGGFFDDFLSHLMCCCCALVQEWREVEERGIQGPEKTKTGPPPFQYMEST